ncbi:hypothetical protein [Weissella minor]|uniref:hypothetical protein n=1 Tax=Weissella minor TaxID=1620 RepID=UPI0020127977|nr:hypothetical protein [Weissella minor]
MIMTEAEFLQLALADNDELKIILKGEIDETSGEKVGVVAVVFITRDVVRAKEQYEILNNGKAETDYFMLYSCPEDVDLTTLGHYPSLEISREDLM